MTESMDATDYAFFLAYGMTQEDEKLNSLLDVEMYHNIDANTFRDNEESYSNFLRDNTQKVKDLCVQP